MSRLVLPLVLSLSSPLIAAGVAPAAPAGQHSMSTMAPSPQGLIKRVREVTQQFLDVQQAIDAQYGQFMGCVAGPQEGAMGIHFVNGGYVFDHGQIDGDHPEALIYEPMTDGKLRLVGVEYIVPVADWQQAHKKDDGTISDEGLRAPVLDGQTFQFNDSPNRYGLPAIYELHVWAWQTNPLGSFVDWNSAVSCDGAR
jgi:hypothetical protein